MTGMWVVGTARKSAPLPPLRIPLRQPLRQKLRERLDAGGAWAAGGRDEMHGAFGLLPVFQDHLDRAGRDRLADDELGQVGNAEAGEQRRHQRLAIVDAQWARGAHARLLAARAGVMPDARV